MNKKLWLLLLLAVLGIGSYAGAYFLRTEKTFSLLHHDHAGLLWLKHEFHLTETQFDRIKSLHTDYVPRCEVMCGEIRESRAQLERAIRSNSFLSPEVTAALERSDRVKSQCERAMLDHIYAVSRNMNPDDGKRFVEMMTRHMLQQAQAGEM